MVRTTQFPGLVRLLEGRWSLFVLAMVLWGASIFLLSQPLALADVWEGQTMLSSTLPIIIALCGLYISIIAVSLIECSLKRVLVQTLWFSIAGAMATYLLFMVAVPPFGVLQSKSLAISLGLFELNRDLDLFTAFGAVGASLAIQIAGFNRTEVFYRDFGGQAISALAIVWWGLGLPGAASLCAPALVATLVAMGAILSAWPRLARTRFVTGSLPSM